DLLHRDAAIVLPGVGAFGQNPGRVSVVSAFTQQHRDRHAGPFTAAREAVDALHVGLGRPAAPRAAAVARALEKMTPRWRRQPPDLLDAELERAIDESVDGERVRRRIEIRN